MLQSAISGLAQPCPYDVPPDVRDCVRGWFGARGEAWLAELPGLASRLARRWEVVPDGPAFGGGTQALVMPVRRRDGSPAVLKVSHPDPENVLEARALSLYRGRGAVALYRRSVRHNAMLLEHVRPGVPLSRSLRGEAMLRAQGGVLKKAARPLPRAQPFARSTALAGDWLGWIRTHAAGSGGMVPHDMATRIEHFLADMSVSAPCGTLVTSDGHCGNILSSERGEWLMADPKPVAGCPEFETGCAFAPFAFGSEDHVPEADPDEDLATLFSVLCGARGAEPSLSGDWAAARALYNFLWAISVRSPQVPRMAELLMPYLEVTLAA